MANAENANKTTHFLYIFTGPRRTVRMPVIICHMKWKNSCTRRLILISFVNPFTDYIRFYFIFAFPSKLINLVFICFFSSMLLFNVYPIENNFGSYCLVYFTYYIPSVILDDELFGPCPTCSVALLSCQFVCFYFSYISCWILSRNVLFTLQIIITVSYLLV